MSRKPVIRGVDVDPEVHAMVVAAKEQAAHIRAERAGMAMAMLRLNKPWANRPRKRREPTRNVRLKAKLAERKVPES